MDALPTSQGRRNVKSYPEGEPGRTPGYHHNPSPIKPSQRRSKRTAGKQTQARGGARSFTLHNNPSTQLEAHTSRHLRHRQSLPRATRAGDRACTSHKVARPDEFASLPHSSPAKDLLWRARQTVAVDTDWLGRRPFVMDVILGNRPSVSRFREDAIMETPNL